MPATTASIAGQIAASRPRRRTPDFLGVYSPPGPRRRLPRSPQASPLQTPRGPPLPAEVPALRRHLFTFLAVCGLSLWISSAERAAGVAGMTKDWVRTAHGWEPHGVVRVTHDSPPPRLHPGLVAAFQLGASVFCLLAFPASAVPVRPSRVPA